MLKILVVDYSDTVRKYLAQNLGELAEITTCDVNVSVLDQVYAVEPDILMIDMMLVGQDAFEIIQVIRSSGRDPQIVATVDSTSEYMRARLASLNVVYTVCRPYKLPALLSRLREIIMVSQSEAFRFADEDARVSAQLLSMDMPMYKSGWPCLHCALCIVMDNPRISLSKELYPQIAKICGGTDKSVEQAIRRLIREAWEKRDNRVWKFFFPRAVNKKAKWPSNKEFLGKIAACLDKEKKAI